MATPFGTEKVIKQKISDANLCTYFVGFDFNNQGEKVYRWNSLINKLVNVIPEFAFGFHEGLDTNNTELIAKVCESAKAIYKIDEFQKAKDIYSNGGYISDDVDDKYLRRGEFGEIILHLILRGFHNTIPLLSKIYFKDSFGHTVHGFDAIHIQPDNKSLWLGESKLYIDGKKGITELINDIKHHFTKDYLNDEFTIVSKKIKHFSNIPEKDHWLNLLDKSTLLSEQLSCINIPLLCTYSSSSFNKHNDETTKEFIEQYENEVRGLKKHFDTNNNHPLKTNLNIILLLFPVKCKIELVKRMHNKLSYMQKLED